MTDVLLDEDALETYLFEGLLDQGGQLQRVERLRHYDVEHQRAEQAAWSRADGLPDVAAKQAWADVVNGWRHNGVTVQRARFLSAVLSPDELRTCNWDYPSTGQAEEIRILHATEHPQPTVLDHDYWIARLSGGSVLVAAMRYTPGGAFLGAEPVVGDARAPYLEEWRLAWAIGEPFGTWWARHGELHRRRAA